MMGSGPYSVVSGQLRLRKRRSYIIQDTQCLPTLLIVN